MSQTKGLEMIVNKYWEYKFVNPITPFNVGYLPRPIVQASEVPCSGWLWITPPIQHCKLHKSHKIGVNVYFINTCVWFSRPTRDGVRPVDIVLDGITLYASLHYSTGLQVTAVCTLQSSFLFGCVSIVIWLAYVHKHCSLSGGGHIYWAL